MIFWGVSLTMADTSTTVDKCCKCQTEDRTDSRLRILHFDDFDYDHVYICTTCHEKERQGKCSCVDYEPGWDGQLVVPVECQEHAVYKNPPCCGQHIMCSRCDEAIGCDHHDHPSCLNKLPYVPGARDVLFRPGRVLHLCNMCYAVEQENHRLEEEAEYQRLINESEAQADWEAQQLTAYDTMAGIRHCRVGRVGA